MLEDTKSLVTPGDISHTYLLSRIGEELLLGSVFYLAEILLFYYAEYLARVKGSMEME